MISRRQRYRAAPAPAPRGGDGLPRTLGVFSLALGLGALLGRALRSDKAHGNRGALALAAVAGVTALDLMARRRAPEARGAASTGPRGVHVARSITVRQSPAEVYAFWHAFENLPRFMEHLESVRMTAHGRSHWRARGPAGTTIEWEAETIIDRPGELIAWRSLPGSAVPNSGEVRFKKAPGGRGTEVQVELRYDPPAGKLGAAIAKLFGQEPAQQVAGDLRRLKQVLETGEVVHSDASIHRGLHPAQPPKDAAAKASSKPGRQGQRPAKAAGRAS